MCMGAKFHQWCPTLCDPMDCSPPDSSVHAILQTRIIGVDCHALLQGIFPIQGSKSFCPLHWQMGSLPSVPLGKPLISTYCLVSVQWHWAGSTTPGKPLPSGGWRTCVGQIIPWVNVFTTCDKCCKRQALVLGKHSRGWRVAQGELL